MASKLVKVKDIQPGQTTICPGHIVQKVIIELNSVTIETDRGAETYDLASDPVIEIV